ncbi:hypothetical protein LTR56_021739 [Elasticomyces elasticus]|nr:hypothetical protein LTR56_021739 [Elasticomyces elasticus]KAK3630702.1 hypothetical protein LTR22_021397 [Elasticomyces elasticus]KAK4909123.1 hypothetical protein LTR49_022094 [Elasticomyces elasticus]KAK5749261.1 hypothetical protein LTS12_020703 [Elasticomyces elasticus]
MDHTNHVDSPNFRHVPNDADWLEEILAMELDIPSVAAASSEGAATVVSHAATLSSPDTSNETTTTPALDEGYASDVYHSTNIDAFDVNDLAYTAGYVVHASDGGLVADSTHYIEHSAPVNKTTVPTIAAAADRTIICNQPSDAPPGRQPAKILQCGTCMSTTLFDRRYELERHMATHNDGNHPCLHSECPYTGARAFKRTEHLRNHRRRIHGI